nr:serine acetyltransferase 5 [Ipomoea batatas]
MSPPIDLADEAAWVWMKIKAKARHDAEAEPALPTWNSVQPPSPISSPLDTVIPHAFHFLIVSSITKAFSLAKSVLRQSTH